MKCKKMRGNKIAVIGSTNMDMVVKAEHIPVPGETVLGGAFLMNPGGKGANQAVTIARLGGNVVFLSKVGNDVFGRQSTQTFEEEGIDISGLLLDSSSPSGVALITVDDLGENSIVVASGANANLNPTDVEGFLKKNLDVQILLMQLEIPMETVRWAAKYAASRGIRVILNPAPANQLIPELFDLIDIITPNSNEAEMLSGIAVKDVHSAKRAAELIYKQGVKNVLITLGAEGAILYNKNGFYAIPAKKIEAIDTTAAGDVFNGALAMALAEKKDLLSGARFAVQVATITATRMGAQSSIPYRNEIILNKIADI